MSENFVLRPQPPIRALAIGAVGTVLGAGLLVCSLALRWPTASMIMAVVLLAISVDLMAIAWVLAQRSRVVVTLTADGFRVLQGKKEIEGDWSTIGRVTKSGDKLILATKEDPNSGHVIRSPRGATDPQFVALLKAIAPVLDAHRGYRPFE